MIITAKIKLYFVLLKPSGPRKPLIRTVRIILSTAKLMTRYHVRIYAKPTLVVLGLPGLKLQGQLAIFAKTTYYLAHQTNLGSTENL